MPLRSSLRDVDIEIAELEVLIFKRLLLVLIVRLDA